MPESLSASKAARHVNCHASAQLELAIPNWEPPQEDPTVDNAANRGTQLHKLFAQIMTHKTKDIKKLSEALAYIGDLRATRRFKVLIEHTVHAEWLQTKPKTTADLVLYVQDELHVIDLKAGKIPVPVVNNKQLLYYALCYGHLAPKAKVVHLHVVQPWADNMEVWTVDVVQLAQFMADMQAAEAAILAGSTQFSPGDHCQFCPANPHSRSAKGSPLCPEMMQMLYPNLIDENEILKGV